MTNLFLVEMKEKEIIKRVIFGWDSNSDLKLDCFFFLVGLGLLIRFFKRPRMFKFLGDLSFLKVKLFYVTSIVWPFSLKPTILVLFRIKILTEYGNQV